MAHQVTPFAGVYTAIITPFRNGKVDYPELERQVNRQIDAGVDGIVAVGTTGESPTLDTAEHLAVIEAIVKYSNGRVCVLAGTGANATSEAVYLVKEADARGVDAHLQVAPYYNKPTQEGLFRHFSAISEATEKPIMLYSIPGRCGIEIGIETVRRLSENTANVTSIKEAGGDVTRVSALRQACGERLTILCGDDGLTLPFMAEGATGVVSVASNLLPEVLVDMVRKFRQGNVEGARSVASRNYALLTDLVFLEGNPVTIKTAMFEAGYLADPEIRLPLVPLSEVNLPRLRAALKEIGLQTRA
ncbi:MAG: 4-hydroxy-tetrahydrodipicolinate synthase [Verrucomicrobiota bacterium JB022]|nr:4-hydroxy-tetrahydrodipicolinate synthase [Verrucomicrobiota bacterium JB022]